MSGGAIKDMIIAMKGLQALRPSRGEGVRGVVPPNPHLPSGREQRQQEEGGFGSRLLGLARSTLQNLSAPPAARRQRMHPGRKFGDDLRER